MTRKQKAIEYALTHKGFNLEEGRRHRIFNYVTSDGLATAIHTEISQGVKEVHVGLLSTMATQCRVRTADFLKLIDCPLDQDGYEQLLRNSGQI